MEELAKDAICFGRTDELEELLDKGVDPNSKDESGNTLLHWAVNTKEIASIKLLVQHGASLSETDDNGNSPLHAASVGDYEAICKLLVELGANVNLKNGKKKSPLDVAKKPLADKMKLWAKEKEVASSKSSPTESARRASMAPPVVKDVAEADKKEKRNSARALKRSTMSEEPVSPPRSESPGPGDEELKAKQRKLLAREEELMHREQDLNRKATELEALKAREKELQDKLAQFEIDQAKLRALVEQHNVDVLGGAMPLISASEVKLKNKVGEGAFAEIHRAEWRGMSVAVKKAFKENEGPIAGKFADADIADIFFREIKIMSKLHHPNIIMVMAACVEPEDRMFVMELCHTDLFAYLHSVEEIHVKDRIEMAIGAASALYFLHSFKPALLHRDIKSSNFLVDYMGVVKLTDFGLCATKGSDHSFGFTTQSADDAHKGTPAYMAPECLKTESFDEKSDVWSFGVVMWELITRQIPWEGMEPTRIYAEVTTGNRLPVGDNTGFPAEYITLMKSCWLDHPKDRPSFREILKKLRSIKKSVKK